MTFYRELRGEMRYFIRSYENIAPCHECPLLAGPLTINECAEYIRLHPEPPSGDCRVVLAYNMDGYVDESMWSFWEEYDPAEWMQENNFSIDIIGKNQLKLFEEEIDA